MQIYIARHERHEAANAFKDRLSRQQIEHLKETKGDFWLNVDTNSGQSTLLLIEDEG